MGAPGSPSVPSTMRATPVRSGISTGSGWLTPSGKIRIASPCRSAAAAALNMSTF